MKFELDDVSIYFPYDFIYPEQYEYIKHLKQCLDVKGHCLLEVVLDFSFANRSAWICRCRQERERPLLCFRSSRRIKSNIPMSENSSTAQERCLKWKK